MAALQQYSTTFLMNALYTNPFAQSFPWENGFTRSQILTELNNRSGQGDVSQIISALPVVGTVGAVKTASGKSSIK